jgi:uncharacterized protein (TIGR02246 family)
MRVRTMVMAGLVVAGAWRGASVRAQAPSAAAGQAHAAATAAEDTAIRAVISKYVEARERRDATGIEAVFTADADQLTSSGDWRKGRPDVVKGTLASSQTSGGTRTITIETVRVIAPGVAIADGRYEIAGLANGTTRSMWTSFTLARAADGWRIAAIRNMLPAAPLPAAAPPTPPSAPAPPAPPPSPPRPPVQR